MDTNQIIYIAAALFVIICAVIILVVKNKKKNVLKGIIVLFTILLIIPSCNERFEEMNKNPKALTEVPDDFLIASITREDGRDSQSAWQSG
jgi:hypothetical protein